MNICFLNKYLQSRIIEYTVRGLIVCKMNIGVTCNSFCEKTKNGRNLSKKINSSEKYNNE